MASPVTIRVNTNANDIARGLTDFIRKQVPFAVAQGINRTAKRVADAEAANLALTFDHPSPFTQKALSVKGAKKGSPTAVVFMKDITAAYLTPYETGGVHKLNSQALLNPKNIKLNQYGQLTRGTLAQLKGRPDIFIGAVMTKAGMVNGVWQRPTDTKRVGMLDSKGKRLRKLHKLDAKANNGRGHLKLLIRFGDALPVKKQLNWGTRARQVVDQWIDRDLSDALAAAVKSAR